MHVLERHGEVAAGRAAGPLAEPAEVDERLVITCNGRNVKSNKRVPLVTPLAELVDFAVRHGVAREKFDEASGIEIGHPRHQLSRRNFEEAGVEATGIWSHDTIAGGVLAQVEQGAAKSPAPAREDGEESRRAAADAPETTGPILTELSLLERMVKDPRCAEAWVDSKQRSGILPVGRHAERQVSEIKALARGLLEGAEAKELDLTAVGSHEFDGLPLGRHRLIGSLQGIHRGEPLQIVYVVPREVGKNEYGRPLHMAALHLLVAWAAGIEATRATIISRHDNWHVGKMKKTTKRQPEPRPEPSWQARIVRLAEPLMDQAAAARRLDAIAALAHEAKRSARPVFGDVATAAAAKREEEFEKALATDFYHRTAECALFGVSPAFAEVFVDHPERVAFLDAFKQLIEPIHVNKGEKPYLLS
ncbi:MAG: hypothetical protein ACKOHG_03640 [Planctomycetia bacterium]